MPTITDENILAYRKYARLVFKENKFTTLQNGAVQGTFKVTDALIEMHSVCWTWVQPLRPRFLKIYKGLLEDLSSDELQKIEMNFFWDEGGTTAREHLKSISHFRDECQKIIDDEVNDKYVSEAFLGTPPGSNLTLADIILKSKSEKVVSYFFNSVRAQVPTDIWYAIRFLLPVYSSYRAARGEESSGALDRHIRGLAAEALKARIDKQNADKFSAREAEQQPASKPAKRELL